jgi:hypothetical protein
VCVRVYFFLRVGVCKEEHTAQLSEGMGTTFSCRSTKRPPDSNDNPASRASRASRASGAPPPGAPPSVAPPPVAPPPVAPPSSLGVEFDDTTLRAALEEHKEDICKGTLTIADWRVGKVKNMASLFEGWSEFNQPLRWDVRNVESMNSMFAGCAKFNQPLLWDVGNVKSMYSMFAGCTAFNQPLRWETRKCHTFQLMFQKCTSLTQRIELDVRAVEPNGLTGLLEGVFKDTREKPNRKSVTKGPKLMLTNMQGSVESELEPRVKEAIKRGESWPELCHVCSTLLLPAKRGDGQNSPNNVAPDPKYVQRPEGPLLECCARCTRPATTPKATAMEKEKGEIVKRPVDDHPTQRFARAVSVLLLRELHIAGETFGCTSLRRMRLYLETIKGNVDAHASTRKDKQRQANAGAEAEVAAVTTAAMDSAFKSLEEAESQFPQFARDTVDFKAVLTPKAFYDKMVELFKTLARVEDAVVTQLKVVEMTNSIRSQAGCGLAALARASCRRDAERAAELKRKLAENENEPPEMDPLYSAAVKAAEALDVATPPAGPRPAMPLDASRPPGSLSPGFFDLEATSGSTTLDFARGLFVCNLMELSSRFEHFSVTRASFGVANFAMQRAALGGLAGKLAPDRMENAKAHIETHERSAGALIREALIDDDALATPRRWVEATMRLLREFRESEAGMLRIVNAGLLPEHHQYAERAHDVDKLWGKAGCGLKGLELSQAAGYLSNVRSAGGPNIEDSFFSDMVTIANGAPNHPKTPGSLERGLVVEEDARPDAQPDAGAASRYEKAFTNANYDYVQPPNPTRRTKNEDRYSFGKTYV